MDSLENKINLKIREIIYTDILPSLSEHNGTLVIEKVRVEKDSVYVLIDYKGACDGCSSASSTIDMIENYLAEELLDLYNYSGSIRVESKSVLRQILKG